MIIRRFAHKDIKRILEIESRSFPKSAYDRFTFFYLSRSYPFLVYEDDKILGYIIFDDRDGHILSIAVDPLYRRRGVGSRLVERVIEKCGKAWIEVRASNKIAQSFYNSLGFAMIGVVPGYYGDEDAYVMISYYPNYSD
jgi:ribosomal-protein-alanine N-acetyltransferase